MRTVMIVIAIGALCFLSFQYGKFSTMKQVRHVLVTQRTAIADSLTALDRNSDAALSKFDYTGWQYQKHCLSGQATQIAVISTEIDK